MFLWKNCAFYHYFSTNRGKQDVLCKDHAIMYGDVLIARLTKSKSFVFAKLDSIDEFIELYRKCELPEQTFYSILIGNHRYLYLDIDYKLDGHSKFNQKRRCMA